MMDIEKYANLQATSDVEHLMADSFLLDGHLTDLYLYPTELKLLQRNKVRVIPIDATLTFSILSGKEGPIGIELKNEKEMV
jgi:hypothetical protein